MVHSPLRMAALFDLAQKRGDLSPYLLRSRAQRLALCSWDALRCLLARVRKLPQEPERILVIRMDHLGDVLLCTPALSVLKRRFPQAKIDFIAKPYAARALQGHPALNRIWELDEAWSRTLGSSEGDGAMSRADLIQHLKEGDPYDLGIDLQGHFRNLRLLHDLGVPALLGPSWRGGRSYLSHVVHPDLTAHATWQNQQVLEPLGVEMAAEEPMVYAVQKSALHQRALGNFADRVALHPGAAHPAKRWPLERFLELARRLKALGQPMLWIVGPGDPPLEEDDLRRAGVEGPILRGLELDALAWLLESSRLFICNDTGTSHLSQAVGCPTLAIFGATDPKRFGPRPSPRWRYVQSPFPQAPCWWPETGHQQPDLDFMGSVSVERVWEELLGMDWSRGEHEP